MNSVSITMNNDIEQEYCILLVEQLLRYMPKKKKCHQELIRRVNLDRKGFREIFFYLKIKRYQRQGYLFPSSLSLSCSIIKSLHFFTRINMHISNDISIDVVEICN